MLLVDRGAGADANDECFIGDILPASIEAILFKNERKLGESFNVVKSIIDNCSDVNKNLVALVDDSREITWGELSGYVLGLQSHALLRNTMPGDRVLIVARDSISIVVSILAYMMKGCVVILVNPMLDPQYFSDQVVLSKAKKIIAAGEFKNQVDELLALNTGLEFFDASIFEDYVAAPCSNMRVSVDVVTSPLDPAFGIFTSGSTGSPKLVIHKHQDFLVALSRYADQVLDLKSSDRVFCTSRVSFAFGLQNLAITLLRGGVYALPPSDLTVNNVKQRVLDFKPSIMFAVPRIYSLLLSDPECTANTFSSLRLCNSAGDVLPVGTANRWMSKFGVEILNSLGSSEVFSTYISNFPGCDGRGSTGQIVPGFEAKLINQEGNPCQLDEPGVLWVRGPSVITSYDSRPSSIDTHSSGWFCTNDVFSKDRDGYYYFVGRNNDMLKVNGLWVSPLEIENTILKIPSVSEVAVVASLNSNSTSMIEAYVVLDKADELIDKDQIKSYCKNELGEWKYPHKVFFMESLPRTVTGKLARYKLGRNY